MRGSHGHRRWDGRADIAARIQAPGSYRLSDAARQQGGTRWPRKYTQLALTLSSAHGEQISSEIRSLPYRAACAALAPCWDSVGLCATGAALCVVICARSREHECRWSPWLPFIPASDGCPLGSDLFSALSGSAAAPSCCPSAGAAGGCGWWIWSSPARAVARAQVGENASCVCGRATYILR